MTKARKNQPASAATEDNDITAEADQVVQTNDKSEVAAPAPLPPRPPSKQQQLAALVVRDEGATLHQMIAVTGWLPHTTRAALTGLKKRGYAMSSDKVDGIRTYRAVAPE